MEYHRAGYWCTNSHKVIDLYCRNADPTQGVKIPAWCELEERISTH
jgi:hypothetical protein